MKKQNTGRRERGERKDDRRGNDEKPRKRDEEGAGRKSTYSPFRKYPDASKSEKGWTKPDGKPLRRRVGKGEEEKPVRRKRETGSFSNRGGKDTPKRSSRSFDKKDDGDFKRERSTNDRPTRGRTTRDEGPKRFSSEKRERPTGDRPTRGRTSRDEGPKRFSSDKRERPTGDRPTRDRTTRDEGPKRFSSERSERPTGDRRTRDAGPKKFGGDREEKSFKGGDSADFLREGRGKGRSERTGTGRSSEDRDQRRDKPENDFEEKRTARTFKRTSDDKPERSRAFSRSEDDKPERKSFRRSDDERPERSKSSTRSRSERPEKSKSYRKSSAEDNRPFERFEKKPGRDSKRKESFTREKKEPFTRERKGSSTRERKSSSPAVEGEIRLNRYIANAGICSRREADDYITAGLVSINGKIITELGTKVMPGDDVRYNGERLKAEKNVYLVLNKPKDYLTTSDDPGGRKTVMELIAKACKERVYPVGRLDRNTTGLLLFTNDGDLAKKLTHPSSNVRKVYHVEVDKTIKKTDLQKMLEGIELEDGMATVDDISYDAGGDKKQVGVELHSGKNRIVRRMFESLGYEVRKLDRVIFAGLTKKDLPRGRWRMLTEMEVGMLKMQTGKAGRKADKKMDKDQLSLF